MSEPTDIGRFSLLGGPLHRLGCRLGLVRNATNTTRLGLAISASLWIPLAALALGSDVVPEVFGLQTIGAHVRLLAVIPLLFLCEAWLEPRVGTFVAQIVRSGVVPTLSLPALEADIARTARLKNSWVAESVCALAAVLFSLGASRVPLTGTAEIVELGRTALGPSLAGHWYWFVCLPFFRFLMIRWLWRLGLWSHFLWRVAALELRLVPTHPDGAGGLGYLEIVHVHFTPLVLAISALECASLAEELSAGTATVEAVYPALALVLVVDALLFVGPLLIVSPKLWACRVKGLSDYMVLAQRYVNDFDVKWLGGHNPGPLLGTPDVQSLADLANSVRIVRDMRVVPVSRRLAVDLAIVAVLPVLPLFLLAYPLAELAQKFFGRLLGL